MARMARSKSIGDLNAIRAKAGESYQAQVVYAYKAFRLRPDTVGAERLLLLLPKDDEQLGIVDSLGSILCDQEPVSDLKSLGTMGADLAHQFSNAVLIAPRYMTAYVAHSLDEVQLPHSDYAVRMRTVCERQHARFIDALQQLSPEQQKWFAAHVMEPSTCRPLALPEAD